MLHNVKTFQDMINQFCDLQFFLQLYLIALLLQFELPQAQPLNHHRIRARLCCKILPPDFDFVKTHQEKFFACSCQICYIVTSEHHDQPVLE